MLRQVGELRSYFRVPLAGVVRMQAGGGEDSMRVPLRQLQRLARGIERAAGDDDGFQACVPGALQQRVAVVIETIVGEVSADVDQLHGDVAAASATQSWRHRITCSVRPC